MLNSKVGGVPEHFNYPWYITLKNKEYTKHNINLRWKDYPGGTGEMCKALRSGEVDIAIVLTEGIIKDIINGNPSKITQTYVKSPLIWGIHVGAKSNFKEIKESTVIWVVNAFVEATPISVPALVINAKSDSRTKDEPATLQIVIDAM